MTICSFLAAATIAIAVVVMIADRTKRMAVYNKMISEAGLRHDVDPLLISAVIRQESNYDSDAVGKHDEVGLMQITPLAIKDWADWHRRDAPRRGLIFTPALNIEIGTWYLAKGLRDWRNSQDRVILALAQYNAGRSRAIKWATELKGKNVLESIPFKSTRHYIERVLRYHQQLTDEDGRQ